MVAGLKTMLTRTAPTLIEDALACFALVVLLYVGLHLPALL